MTRLEVEPVSDHELDSMYREMLDEIYGPVSIAGYEYETSQALADVDPVAYRCGFSDYISSLLEDVLTEKDGKYYWTDELEEGESA